MRRIRYSVAMSLDGYELHSVEEFAHSGIVLLKYDVVGPSAPQAS